MLLHFMTMNIALPANDDVTFTIGQTTGELVVSGTIDRESISRYFVTVDVSLVIVYA